MVEANDKKEIKKKKKNSHIVTMFYFIFCFL